MENRSFYLIVTRQRRAREPFPCTDGSSEAAEAASGAGGAAAPNAAWTVLRMSSRQGETGSHTVENLDCFRLRGNLEKLRKDILRAIRPKAVGASARGPWATIALQPLNQFPRFNVQSRADLRPLHAGGDTVGGRHRGLRDSWDSRCHLGTTTTTARIGSARYNDHIYSLRYCTHCEHCFWRPWALLDLEPATCTSFGTVRPGTHARDRRGTDRGAKR